MPYSGPASAYGVIGKTEEAYFKKINPEGGINGPKINFFTYDDRYSPPKHAVKFGDPEISQRQEGAAAVRRHRRHQVERSEGFSVDHGLAALLPERGAYLRQVPDEGEAGRQDRGALPE